MTHHEAKSAAALVVAIIIILTVLWMVLAYVKKLFRPADIEKLKMRKDVEGLIRALENDRFPYVAGNAARALGELRHKKAVNPLIRLLGDTTKDYGARIISAVVLGRIGGTQAIEPLMNTMDLDPDKIVQAYAAVGLWLLDFIDISVPYSLFLKNQVSLYYFSHSLDLREKTKAAKDFYQTLSSDTGQDMIGIALEATGFELLEVARKDILNSESKQLLFIKILEKCTEKDQHFELIKYFCEKKLVNGLNAENRARILDILWKLIYSTESYGSKHATHEMLEKFYKYAPIREWAIDFAYNFRSDTDDRIRKKAENNCYNYEKIDN